MMFLKTKRFITQLFLGSAALIAYSGFVFAQVSDLRVDSLETIDKQKSAMACLNLNYAPQHGVQHIDDFVQVESSSDANASIRTKHSFALQLAGQKACLGSLKYGRHYFVTFREGFPLVNDEKLAEDYEYQFEVPDREASASFQSAAHILPAYQQPLVPVKVVNKEKANLIVFRLSPEQVQERLLNGRFFKSMDGYDIQYLKDDVQVIAEQEIDLSGKKNVQTTINLDLSDVMADQQPGAYMVMLDDGERKWSDRPTQALIYTDTGMASYQGEDGLHVYARSYESAMPKSGIELALVAKNHDVLATAVTNELGKVTFSYELMSGKHGLKPVQVRYLSNNGEFAVLHLTDQGLDLSEQPIGGAAPLSMLNTYLFSERGVYRLGEEIVLTGMIRDKSLQAVGDMPLTIQLVRPDGDVALTSKITKLKAGGFQQRFAIPTSGRTGQWQAKLFLSTDGDPIGEYAFEVADYVPETIEVTVAAEKHKYINDPLKVVVQSDFLYGAPASDLDVQSEVTVTQNRRLFADYKDYVFGSSEAFANDFSRLEMVETDNQGQAVVELPNGLLRYDWRDHALALDLRVEVVEPSGRAAIRSLKIPALQHIQWVGVKSEHDYPVYDRDKPVLFQLASIENSQQAEANKEIHYQVIREDWDYHWYRSGSRWRYRISKFDDGIVTSGQVVTNDRGLANIDLGVLDWGRYRLEVTHGESGQMTQLPFRNGWWNANGSQSALPDNVRLAPAKNQVEVGETLPIKVEAPYAGKLHLVIANDSILEEQIIDLASSDTEVELLVKENWGQQFYVLASVYRPGKDQVGPARAVGVNYVKINRPSLHAAMQIIAPVKVEPKQPVYIELETGLPEGSQVMIAAVDEGILQLTRFASPNPNKWFTKKRRLGMDIRDLYGHLIQHEAGEVLKLRFGGDSDAGAPTAPPMENFVKPMVIVSDLVSVNADGNVSIPMTFPQFNGKVRLMAVGFGEQAMSSASDNMLVRHPLVVQPNLPRFLATDDVAEIGVDLHNLELPDVDIDIHWQTTSGLNIEGQETSVTLAKDERKAVKTKLHAVNAGVNEVILTVKPQGYKSQTYTWDITVVHNRFIETNTQQVHVPAGERETMLSLVGDFTEASRRLTLSATNSPDVPTQWIVKSLSDYPFGCLEQTTSKAWPVLMIDAEPGSAEANKRNEHIKKAIAHLATMQMHNGSFSLWSGGSSREEWLSMYATEFLMEAKRRGHDVPQRMLSKASNYVNNYTSDYPATKAYAYYLQAQLGSLDPGDLRYLSQQVLEDQRHRVQTRVHLMLAAELMGQNNLVIELFDSISSAIPDKWYRYDYGSRIRDAALIVYGVLALGEPRDDDLERAYAAVQKVFTQAQERRWLSTQEKAWLLRLADKLGEAESLPADLPISIDLRSMLLADAAGYLLQQDSWASFKNLSAEPMYLTLTARGVNKSLSEAASFNGVELRTTYVDLTTGNEVELKQVKLGAEILVKHSIEFTNGTDTELSLQVPMPAGFELEIPRLTGERQQVTQLDRSTPTFEEFRDDRYLAAWSLKRGNRSLGGKDATVAYVMRAVTPGEFIVPAGMVEDMYRPEYRANTAESRVTIIP